MKEHHFPRDHFQGFTHHWFPPFGATPRGGGGGSNERLLPYICNPSLAETFLYRGPKRFMPIKINVLLFTCVPVSF